MLRVCFRAAGGTRRFNSSGSLAGSLLAIDPMSVCDQSQFCALQGVAGGVNPALRVGDVVVPKSWFNIHHQKLIRSIPGKTVRPGVSRPTRCGVR